jgi:hypothetical protein
MLYRQLALVDDGLLADFQVAVGVVIRVVIRGYLADGGAGIALDLTLTLVRSSRPGARCHCRDRRSERKGRMNGSNEGYRGLRRRRG